MTENATKNANSKNAEDQMDEAPRWEIVDATPGRDEEVLDTIGGKLNPAKSYAQQLFDEKEDAGRVILRSIEGGKTKKAFERDLGEATDEREEEVVTTADPDPNGHELGIPEEKEEAASAPAKTSDSTLAFAAGQALSSGKISQEDHDRVITREITLDEAVARVQSGEATPEAPPKKNGKKGAGNTFYTDGGQIAYRGTPSETVMGKKHNIALGVRGEEIAMVNSVHVSPAKLGLAAISPAKDTADASEGTPLDAVFVIGKYDPAESTVLVYADPTPDQGAYLKSVYGSATITLKKTKKQEKEEAKAAKIADLNAAKEAAKAEAATEVAQNAGEDPYDSGEGDGSDVTDDTDLLLAGEDEEVVELTVEPIED